MMGEEISPCGGGCCCSHSMHGMSNSAVITQANYVYFPFYKHTATLVTTLSRMKNIPNNVMIDVDR